MAVIVVNFADIAGESTVGGLVDGVDAIALSESMEVAAATSGGRLKGARNVGQAAHSDIELTRFKDIASPKLAEACSSGRNVGDVTIDLYRSLETGLVSFAQYKLSDVFISRIEQETLDENGNAFNPHLSDSANVAPSSVIGASGLGFANLRTMKNERPAVRSVSYLPGVAFTNLEVERVYLSAAKVNWSYTQFINGQNAGVVEKGWNIQAAIQS